MTRTVLELRTCRRNPSHGAQTCLALVVARAPAIHACPGQLSRRLACAAKGQ